MSKFFMNRSYAVGICLAHKWAGYRHEGHLRGLNQPAQAGFVAVAEGFSPDFYPDLACEGMAHADAENNDGPSGRGRPACLPTKGNTM